MDGVTLTNEQFAELLQTIKGPGVLASPVIPSESDLCRNLALDILQTVSRNAYWGMEQGERPGYEALKSEVARICKEHI